MARVLLADIDVMFFASSNGLAGAREAFAVLEAALGSPRGRHFYGTYLDGEYRACAAAAPGDSPDTLGLRAWRIPGGAYERRRLLDWQDRPGEIAELFDQMAADPHHDRSRPSIEYYRSARELLLFSPVT